jgi:integrase
MKTKLRIVLRSKRGYVMRWVDSLTGRDHERALKTHDFTQAEARAKAHFEKLAQGGHRNKSTITWEEFRDQFEMERYPDLKHVTENCYEGTFNIFQRYMEPRFLAGIDNNVMSNFKRKLYDAKLRDATIAKHLRVMKAALRWAKQIGILKREPYIQMPKRVRGAKLMKGRPVTEAELSNMIEALPQLVKQNELAEWEFLIRGVSLSGLRLNEAINLYWDRLDKLRVELNGETSRLYIPGELQKNGKDQITPLTPDFVKHLLQVPEHERNGQVFKLQLFQRIRRKDWLTKLSKMGTLLGKIAKIVVSVDTRTGKTKFASFHDLRRTFAERWSKLLLPQELQQLMRHESFTTTLQYYIGNNADNLSQTLAKKFPKN